MKTFFAKLASVALATSVLVSAAQAETIRIALAEPPSDEMAAFFVALDRAKANGVDYEWTAFAEEELAIQAVLSGDMDIAFGTPYAAMQRSKAPVRIIFQLSRLVFFPVTTKEFNTLKDLDGQPIMLHSRGGGTDSIANVIEDREGITFGERSYVPGSGNRVAAMLAGQANATILDLSNRNKIIAEAGDKFNSLPMFEVKASDEALFANLDWIKENEAAVNTLVKALQLLRHRGRQAPLALAGSGKARLIWKTQRQVQAAGLEHQVQFLGQVQDLPKTLMQHQIFVLSTHYEGMPLALIEAMACACACIGSDVVGVREVIEHGRNGLLVPEGDAQALADAIEQSHTDGTSRRQTAMQNFVVRVLSESGSRRITLHL